jgi:hypothetical protein
MTPLQIPKQTIPSLSSAAKHLLPLRKCDRDDRVCPSIDVEVCECRIRALRSRGIGSSDPTLHIKYTLRARSPSACSVLVEIVIQSSRHCLLGKDSCTLSTQQHVRVFIACRKCDRPPNITSIDLQVSASNNDQRE